MVSKRVSKNSIGQIQAMNMFKNDTYLLALMDTFESSLGYLICQILEFIFVFNRRLIDRRDH